MGGMDGGIFITKIEIVRKEWSKLKGVLIKSFKKDFEDSENYCKTSRLEILIKVEELPDNIDNVSNSELLKILSIFNYCDTPTILGEYLITAKGDYVEEGMNNLSYSLKTIVSEYEDGYYIETWT